MTRRSGGGRLRFHASPAAERALLHAAAGGRRRDAGVGGRPPRGGGGGVGGRVVRGGRRGGGRRAALKTLLTKEGPIEQPTLSEAVRLLVRVPLRGKAACEAGAPPAATPTATAPTATTRARTGAPTSEHAALLGAIVRRALNNTAVDGGHAAVETEVARHSRVAHPSRRVAHVAAMAAAVRAGNSSAAGELAEEHAAMGRRLQIDWSTVNFDDFSLTFIDIVLTHPPLDWYKEYGDRALFGDLGGAGIEISATSNNMAWLRVGLFGGGFGLDLDNRGYAGAFLISLEIPIIDAGVQFKLDASYRVDIPADVLNVVDKIVDGATDVMAGFEAAKAAVLKYVYRFVEIGHHVLDVIDDFLDSMPDEIIEKITGVFPMLAGNTSDVISGIFGLLSNATGLVDLLRESGIIELLDKLVLAVDKVEAVAFNNTFVQGVEEVLEKADELIGGAIGFIGQVVDNGTLTDIIDHIGDGVSSVAGFFNASEGALKVIDTILP